MSGFPHQVSWNPRIHRGALGLPGVVCVSGGEVGCRYSGFPYSTRTMPALTYNANCWET